MTKKQISHPLRALRLLARGKGGDLPGLRIVLPRESPAAGFTMRLLDPETGDGTAFENSAGLEIVMGWKARRDEGETVVVGLDEHVSDSMRRRLLSGAPMIARVTHLYEIVSVEEEN